MKKWMKDLSTQKGKEHSDLLHTYDENGCCFERDQRQQMHEVIKQRGLDSVKRVCEIVDCSPQTLKNWYLKKPKLFNIVLTGSVEFLNQGKEDEK